MLLRVFLHRDQVQADCSCLQVATQLSCTVAGRRQSTCCCDRLSPIVTVRHCYVMSFLVSTCLDDQTFSVSGPPLWNSLPFHVRPAN